MKWAAMYGFYFHRCPEVNRRNCTAHGQALLLSLNASPMSPTEYKIATTDVKQWWFTLNASNSTNRVQTTAKVKAKDKPPQDNTQPHHHFGAELELVDEFEGDVVLTHRGNPPQGGGADIEPNIRQEDLHQEPELVRRYPRRVRRPPEFYS